MQPDAAPLCARLKNRRAIAGLRAMPAALGWLMVAIITLVPIGCEEPDSRTQFRTSRDAFDDFRAYAAKIERVAYVNEASRSTAELTLRQRLDWLLAKAAPHEGELEAMAAHCAFDHQVTPMGPAGEGMRGVRYAGMLASFPSDNAEEVRVLHLAVREPDAVLLEFTGDDGQVTYFRLDSVGRDALGRLIQRAQAAETAGPTDDTPLAYPHSPLPNDE